LLSYGEDTSSELWTLVLLSFIAYNHSQTVLLFTANIHLPLAFNSFAFIKTGEIDNLTVPLGQSSLVVCAGLRVAKEPRQFLAPLQGTLPRQSPQFLVPLLQPSRHSFAPTG